MAIPIVRGGREIARQSGAMPDGACRAGRSCHEQQNFDVEQSDLGWIQMSDNIWRVEAPALNGLFPGVNSVIICDCGNQTFEIGTEVDLVGNKYIRYVECAGAGKQTRTQRIQVQFPGVSNMMLCLEFVQSQATKFGEQIMNFAEGSAKSADVPAKEGSAGRKS